MNSVIENEYAYIYKCSWFNTKRHTIPHTRQYYEKMEDTLWIFESEKWFQDLVRVELIKVNKNIREYQSAVRNSSLYKEKN